MSELPAPTRRGEVEGRTVAIFDGLLPLEQVAEYTQALHRAPFTRTEQARPDTAEYRHWASEMPLANLAHLPVWPATERAMRALLPASRYRPYRAYTNHASYGDMLFSHTDAQPGSDEFTALWFLCESWESEWGGETLFFDQSGDAQFVCSPRPGRLVLFDGAIRHAGRAPSRICFVPRYTFAIKLERAP